MQAEDGILNIKVEAVRTHSTFNIQHSTFDIRPREGGLWPCRSLAKLLVIIF